MKKRIIFLNSYSPRTGHNFVSEVLKIFSNHEVLIHNRSETRLSTILNEYYAVYDRSVYHKTDKDFMDYMFVKGLRERILGKSDKEYVMIKDTSFVGKETLLRVFPDDIHIVLLRDPKGVFNSIMKGMKFRKPGIKNLVKKMTFSMGLYPYHFSRKVSKQVLAILPDLDKFIVIRYEDLHQKDDDTLALLKKIFNSDKAIDAIKTEIDAIEVINSSFLKETGAATIWDAKPKTEKFDPVNRKGNSGLVRKAIVLGAKPLRKKLGYI